MGASTSEAKAAEIDLDHILEATRKGQWDVHDFDWSRPLEGAENLSKQELRDAALMIVFTAGLERQAARIFALCADYVDDPRAKAIYRLFERDETRHADAEMLMARRYGVGWKDLPLPVRIMFRYLRGNFENPTRDLYEFTSSQIILFEIGLDAILIPALKTMMNDPLQAEVFRRIDIDESRHLAMDYWLLERTGRSIASINPGGKLTAKDIPTVAVGLARSWRRIMTGLVLLPMGFTTMFRHARTMSRRMVQPERQEKYWNRVKAVPDRAPHAMNIPQYRMGVNFQKQIMRYNQRMMMESSA